MGDQSIGVRMASADVLRTVSDIWLRALGPKGRASNTSLLHVGVGTKRILRLLDEIEACFGVRLPIGIALKLGTVEALTNAVQTRRWPEPSPLVLLKDGSDDHPPLYLVPAIWGIVLESCALAAAVDHPGKTWGLQPPGFDGDPPTFRTIQDLAAHYAKHINSGPDHPVNIIGFSVGGLIALETARNLRALNRRLGVVGLIDTLVAERHWPLGVRARFLWARSKARLHTLINVHGERRADALRNFLRPLRNRILGALFIRPVFASAYQPDLDIRLKTVVDRLLVANETYVPHPVDFPLVLYRASRGIENSIDVAEIWRPMTPKLEVVEVDGTHGNMMRPPLVSGLAAKISARLNGLDANTGRKPA